MREYEVPANYEIPADVSMADTVFRHEKQSPSAVMFMVARQGGGWDDVTAAEFAKQVTAVAKGLIASGVELGDRVAIMSAHPLRVGRCSTTRSGPPAAAPSRSTTSSAAEQAKWILEDSGTTLLVVEHAKHGGDDQGRRRGGRPAGRCSEILQIDGPGAVDELITRGADVTDEPSHERRAQVNASSPATLIYTSGTTGRPKGVQLTHSNFYAESSGDEPDVATCSHDGKRTLMFLPLAHVFARGDLGRLPSRPR